MTSRQTHCWLSTHCLLYIYPNNHNINNKTTMPNYKKFTFIWETKTVYIYQCKTLIMKDERWIALMGMCLSWREYENKNAHYSVKCFNCPRRIYAPSPAYVSRLGICGSPWLWNAAIAFLRVSNIQSSPPPLLPPKSGPCLRVHTAELHVVCNNHKI